MGEDEKKAPVVVTETKVDKPVEAIDTKEAATEKLKEQTNSGLEAIDSDIIKNYLSTKLVGKELAQTTVEEKQGVTDMSEAIFKRIKKIQRVPLDITINSWISGVVSMFKILSPSAEIPETSNEKLSQISSTVGAFDKIRDQFEGKISKAMSQFQALSTGGTVMGELETAFTTLEQKVTTLKDNKDALKDKAKASNMSIKAYYQSQTRLFVNEFITQLKGGVPEPLKQNNTANNQLPENNDENEYDNLPTNNIDVKENEFTFSVPIGSPVVYPKIDIRSGIGPRNVKNNPLASHDHKGIDIAVPKGTDIVTPAEGKVIYIGYQESGAGHYIDISHGKFITRYFHLSKVVSGLKIGDIVKKAQKIAESGDTGNAKGHPHLHYEIRDTTDVVKADKQGAGKYKILNPADFMDANGDGKIVAMATYHVSEDNKTAV